MKFNEPLNKSIMKKTLLFLVLTFLTFSVFSQKNQLIEQFQKEAHRAYLENAKSEQHKLIKSQKVPTTYNIGDTKTFWRWDLSVMPPLWVEEEGICKAVGEQSYVFVATDEWDNNINQADVDQIMAFLEDSTLNTTEYGIVSMDTMLFGETPDELDNDPKVIFFFSALGQFNGSVFDGYFSEYNQMTEAEAQAADGHSNECEMLYMSCDPVDPTAISTMSVLSHELQHLIHWGYDDNEDTWLNEGCSELAMVVFGQPDPITTFPSNVNNNLTVWNQQWVDYVKVQLFFTYLYEHFGADFIKSIEQNPTNGVASIEEALIELGYSITFEQVFDNWVLANFINDTEVDEGQYGYELLNLPNFSYVDKNINYPINLLGNINNCAARYYKIPNDYLQEFEFNFTNSENWDVNLLLYDENDSLVDIQNLDINTNYILLQNEWDLNNIYYTLSNHKNGTGNDDYVTDISLAGASNNEFQDTEFSIANKNNLITLILPSNVDDNAKITIFDVNGKQIYNKNSVLSTGLNFIEINTTNLVRGIYLINISTSSKIYQTKFVK